MRVFQIKDLENLQEFLDYITEIEQPTYIFQSPNSPSTVVVSKKNIKEEKLEDIFEKNSSVSNPIVKDENELIFTEEDFENEEWLLFM